MDSTASFELKEIPLVGKFDFADSSPLIVPGPDDVYAKALEQLDEFYRDSERLRDLA